MRKQLLSLALFLVTLVSSAQQPYRAILRNDEMDLNLFIDLYHESIEVPGMSMFGLQHGYMNGNIYGTWIVTSCKIEKKGALLTFSNDLGSETQKAILEQSNDSIYKLKHTSPSCMKKVVEDKLVKLPSEFIFKRIGIPETKEVERVK